MNVRDTFDLFEDADIEDSKQRIADLVGKPYDTAILQVKRMIEDICNMNDFDITITGIEFTGSQRFGEPTPESDLDVVFTYVSNDDRVREDDLFNCLNDEDDEYGKLAYEGFELDINPIEDGDIDEYIADASKFRKQRESVEKLDELLVKDYDRQDDSSYYHFYTDLNDLVNSLLHGKVYSGKNLRASQYDSVAGEKYAYVCMTKTEEGKKGIVTNYDRAFGIAFDGQTFERIASKQGFVDDKEYSQVGAKLAYKPGKKVAAAYIDNALCDFEIHCIGQLSDGRYFISGGQGADQGNLWTTRFFEDVDLYNTLHDWYMKALASTACYDRFYWFKDSFLGEPKKNGVWTDKKGVEHIIDVTGNLNKKYVPRLSTDESGYAATIEFNFNDLEFKEVLGIGQARFDNSIKKGRDICYCGLNSKRGYVGPKLYGKNIDSTGMPFPDTPKTFLGRPTLGRQQVNLIADEPTYNALCAVFNEHEFRAYVDNKKDFAFKPNDINIIILPELFRNGKIDTVNLATLANNLAKDNKRYANVSDDALFSSLVADKVIIGGAATGRGKNRVITNVMTGTLEIIKALIDLLANKYNHVEVEIIEGNSQLVRNADKDPYQQDRSDKTIASAETRKPGDHTRYITKGKPDMSQAKQVSGFSNGGHDSVIAPIQLPETNETIEARIGAEILVGAKDTQGKKYVLMVNKAHQSDTFLELPGGGFYTVNDTPDQIAKQRLGFKAGLDLAELEPVKDLNTGLVMFEEGVAKNKEVLWEASYYHLFMTNYNKELTEADIEYSHQATQDDGTVEYTAYMKWIPVDGIDFNRAVTSRYSNLIKRFISRL